MANTFFSLLQTYFVDATVFAEMHGTLIVVCVLLWRAEFRRMIVEGHEIKGARRQGWLADPSTEVGRLWAFALSLAAKDRLVDPASISQKLGRAISPYDTAFRACINGFTIVGLLGTLYNL